MQEEGGGRKVEKWNLYVEGVATTPNRSHGIGTTYGGEFREQRDGKLFPEEGDIERKQELGPDLF